MYLEVKFGSHEIFKITPLYHKMDSKYILSKISMCRDIPNVINFYFLFF